MTVICMTEMRVGYVLGKSLLDRWSKEVSSSGPGKSLISLRKNRNTNVAKAEYMRDEIQKEPGSRFYQARGRS